MSKFFHNRRALLALTIVVAIVAVVYPTCRMVGCSSASSMMPGSSAMLGSLQFSNPMADLPRFANDCGGQYLFTSNPPGVMPAGLESLLLALIAAVGMALMMFSPQVAMRPVYVAYAEPPPRPLEPRGERLVI